MGYFGGWWDNILIKKTPQPTVNLKPAVPSIDMTQTQLTAWSEEKKDWEIEAERIWQSVDGNYIYFQKIEKGIAYSVKDRRVDFTAGWARWEKIREQLFLGDGLEARVEGSVILTNEATINYRTEEMICPGEVHLSKKDGWTTAKTMKIDFKKEEMFLEGDVVIVQKEDQATADGVIYNFDDEKFKLVGPKEVFINP